MSSRKLLYEIEEKYGRYLDAWDRSKAKEATASFITPYMPPPKEYVIQGLMPAPKPRKNTAKPNGPLRRALPPANGLCAKCDFCDKINGKCLVKRVIGDETACYHIRPQGLMPAPKPVEKNFTKSNKLHSSEAVSTICHVCDYYDKIHSICSLERSGLPCAYKNRELTIKQGALVKRPSPSF